MEWFILYIQETTSDVINHLRFMIEETEAQALSTHRKLFVLLLHFPPAMFFDSCYPSLFLRGWNHYYLDSIGHSPTLYPGTINIEEWFQRCCFPNKGLYYNVFFYRSTCTPTPVNN